MGIKGLTKLIQQTAEGSYKEGSMKSYFGRTVAMDATMFLYQFLIAIRYGEGGGNLTNDAGDTTSHINGFLYRTIRMMENGIKPVYIFDGKPPDFKAEELAKRKEKREKAEQELKEAEETGDTDKVVQMQKRTVKVTKQHVKEVQDLLTFMGVPWFQAPGEAEAQASRMCAQGVVYGTGTEDMDALTFGTRRLVRHLTDPEARKKPVMEFDLEKVLKGMDVTMEQFIDICILCGCDYCPSIRGIGPKRAVEFIRKYKNIETMVEKLKSDEKYKIPEDWEYKKARDLFKNPDVTNKEHLPKFEWKAPMEQELTQFLVDRMNFGMDRVKKAVERLKACKGKSAQRRLDSFFKVMPSPSNASNKKKKGDDKNNGKVSGKKRKRDEKNGNTNNGAPKNKKVRTKK
mmetsp:Transcript_18698/g.29665  ORF Transcript_18698/g.29665 Transcript_18698/m.29665 type:complete len:401 (+) Transcript_18698:2-1204(+)|eukprot:CAMPEP_0197022000 /NCGR_PEP_ID=MMETSP1384-20130603/2896_1 /TAXON_ID=29189 /ORGANISM="Ammonia sp." /LENGTH=400 /DNA_ID=CAMNT_0042449955 /DNA_START=77 /DNA_END=1279 /DNA_ORIENTATION=+